MTTLTVSSTANLRHAMRWRQTALARLTASRPALAEALIAMPASIERLHVERTLAELDRSVEHTRRSLAETERQLVASESGS